MKLGKCKEIDQLGLSLPKASGKVSIICNGCPENRLDAAQVQKFMVDKGWIVVKNWAEADIILFNGCGMSLETSKRTLKEINEIQSRKTENQHLIVWGCLPRIDPEGLEKEFHGIVSAGSELLMLPQLINTSDKISHTTANTLVNLSPPLNKNKKALYREIYRKPARLWVNYLNSKYNLVKEDDPSIFYIKISSGCRSKCSYCAIKKSRGSTKSKPIADVVSEFRQGLMMNHKKFSLIGTDLGSYGLDFGNTLVDLLKVLVNEKGDFKISLRNLNPFHLKNMLDGFITVLESNKISYVEVAVESGNNRILSLMNRAYTIEEYKMLISAMRKACPQLIIRTQIIVGFPTETENEFQESMRLVDEIAFDYIEVYEFSPRPGTEAEQIEPKVPIEIRHERFLKLYKKVIVNCSLKEIKHLLLNKTMIQEKLNREY